MPGHTFFGKSKLCYTDVSNFTDIQGIGHDPLYKRYDSVFSVVKRHIPVAYQHFLAAPEYLVDEGLICWHVENGDEHPLRLPELTDEEREEYRKILQETVNVYKESINSLEGEELRIMAGALKYIDEERIYCANNKVYLVAWGMDIDKRQYNVVGSVIHDFEYEKKYVVTYDVGKHGILKSKLEKRIKKKEGEILSEEDIPQIICEPGWIFEGWVPSPVGFKVNGDTSFVANYSKDTYKEEPDIQEDFADAEERICECSFISGNNGKIIGNSVVYKTLGSILSEDDIPKVIPNNGYIFVGWDKSTSNPVDSDVSFIAQYEKIQPAYYKFYQRFLRFWTENSCLKWLMWILLLLVLLLLLSLLLKNCNSCQSPSVVKTNTVKGSDGNLYEDNGYIKPYTDYHGNLPDDDRGVSPLMREDGTFTHLINNPGSPKIVGDRLLLFMEDEYGDIDALAKDFKQEYPGNEYSIVGYDKEIKMLVIQIPEAERENISKTITNKLSNHKFIVFDEDVYEIKGQISDSQINQGWHLDAIHLKEGWNITKGDRSVKVAIVDDGLDSEHPMFEDRIVDAYNVYTQSNTLGKGSGHGTHTAGIAVGSDQFLDKGAAGGAPNCLIMPVQVVDNNMCPLSALIAGVMYSIHHDADVVNISIAPSFQGMNVLPVEQQNEIANTQFNNVALLWDRVCKIASRKNCILVFAAGNDDILTSIPPENRNESSIVVTAVDNRMYPTVFTNYGPCSDVSAPGKNIYSAFPDESFKSFDGTSMAAPIVTGTIALMKSINKDLTVKQARDVLYSSGADVYGWIPPMVLVDKALKATKVGDFKRIERESRAVPDSVNIHLNSGVLPPRDKVLIIEEPINPRPESPGGTDYDAIRRKIEEYKQKIEELEKLLP